MAKVTVAIRLPYEDTPREIIVDQRDYTACDRGVLVTRDGIQVFYPWHRVDWVAKAEPGRER